MDIIAKTAGAALFDGAGAHVERVLSGACAAPAALSHVVFVLDSHLHSHLHSLSRQLIELRIEHADLNASVDRLTESARPDELLLRRLKKRRLALRDEIARVEQALDPQEPA